MRREGEDDTGGGDGLACTADPLLVPSMISATTTASTRVATLSTAARRTQYVCVGSGPTGWSTLLIPAEPKDRWTR